MDYQDNLRARLRAATTLCEADITQIVSRFERRAFAKHAVLLGEGQVCTFWGFVQAGLVRLHTHTAAGDEYTNGFAQEGAFLTELVSFTTRPLAWKR